MSHKASTQTTTEASLEQIAERGLFIVGNARSGTSIFCDSLNLSNDILLLQEAHFFLNHDRKDFVAWFNSQHENFQNSRSKGTYLPAASESGWIATLVRLSKQYRYFGEKVAFGVADPSQTYTPQELFFEFHARHFFRSTYFLIIRKPAEVVWSMMKMWPDLSIDVLIESWLRTIDISLDTYQFFPKTNVIFWEDFNPGAVTRIARLLGTDIVVPTGMINEASIHSNLDDGYLPAGLLPYRHIVKQCHDIYRVLRESFNPESFRYNNRVWGQRQFFHKLKQRIRRLQAMLRSPAADQRTPYSAALESGERLVPERANLLAWGEHVSRYVFAAKFVAGKRVLDAGCGTGYGSVLLHESGAATVVGVDISSEAVAYAQTHYGRPGLEFQTCTLDALAFPDESFDVIVMLEVLEHLYEPDECLQELRRVLKADGVLVVSTPNQAEHPAELLNPFHVHEYTRQELATLLGRYFGDIRLFRFGITFGSFILPVDFQQYEAAAVHPHFLKTQPDSEAPFLLAVCSPEARTEMTHHALVLPYSFHRLDYYQAHGLQNWERAAANEVVVLSITRAEMLGPAIDALRPNRIAALREIIRRMLDEQQYTIAAPLLNVLTKRHPQQPEWHYLYALCLHLQGDATEEALTHYQLALESGFDEFWVRYNRGALLYTLGKIQDAFADLKRAAILQPEHEGVCQLLTQLRAATADESEATKAGRNATISALAITRELNMVVPDAILAFSPTSPDNFEVELYTGMRLGLAPGKVVFELGTFCGVLTVLAARLTGDARRVIVFEASPTSVERAQAMLAANDLKDVRIVNAFVSHQSGAAQDFFLIDDGAGAAVQSADPTIKQMFPEARKVVVPTLTLDEWTAEHGTQPDVVKIDIEGAEFLALKGMQRLLATQGPDLILELHGDRMPGIGGSLPEVYDLLAAAGYGFLDLHTGEPQTAAKLLSLYPIYGHIFCSKSLAASESRSQIVEQAIELVAQQRAYKQLKALAREARRHIDQKEFQRAIACLEELLSSWPDHPEGNYLIGYALHMLRQQPEQALHHYERALQLGFAEFWVRYNRGSLLLSLGRTLEAIPDLERAVALSVHTGAKELLAQARQSLTRATATASTSPLANLIARAQRSINKLRRKDI